MDAAVLTRGQAGLHAMVALLLGLEARSAHIPPRLYLKDDICEIIARCQVRSRLASHLPRISLAPTRLLKALIRLCAETYDGGR
jgi:hypothetical protein